MITYNALNDVLRFRNMIDDFFNETRPKTIQKNYPLIQVKEKEDEIEITAVLPGVSLDDIEMNLIDKSLHIEVDKKADYSDAHYIRRERLFGRFKRSLQLPYRVQADKVEAVLNNGILRIKLLKSEEAKPRKITVK